MRVRQCRLSGRRVPGSGFCVWRSDSNRYSGSALASCLPCWLCQLMHYSTHSTRKRELSYTTTERALAWLDIRGWNSPEMSNALTCCADTKKPKTLTSGLNSLCRQSKLWRRYQIYMKYMSFSSVLQELRANLSPFVVNVIALLR